MPIAAIAQSTSVPAGFQSDGIYGCNQTGSYAMSVGAMAAIGGVYVPVNDAAVTLNTGYLVYKECVLRGIVDNERKSATSGLIKKELTDFMTDRNGNPLFSQNITAEQLGVADASFIQDIQNGSLNALNPAFKASVTRALVRRYQQSTRLPANGYTCSYSGDMTPILNGQTFSWSGLMAEGDPACNPIFAEELANNVIMNRADTQVNNLMTRLQWGQGTYDMQTTDANGVTTTVTPSTIVNALAQQAVTSGFRQTENANDIGQMLNALFAGMGAQIIGDSQGLGGLTQAANGQLSYLDQVAKESSDALVGSAVNAALQILTAARTVEATYNQVINNIANNLAQTIQQLRSTEAQCWNLIIQHVCASSATSTPAAGTCTDADGNILHIATSTTRSQSVIDAQITPLASSTVINIQNSNNALSAIDRLIAGVTNTNSLDVQRLALQQLDTLVSNGALHNQNDVANVQQQYSAVQTATANMLTTTAQAWGDSTDVNVGWCNVNNPAVVQYWDAQWR